MIDLIIYEKDGKLFITRWKKGIGGSGRVILIMGAKRHFT